MARSALLPMLHLVQSVQGYVSPEGVTFCAEELRLTKAEVGAVATFYTMYKRRPTGRHLVSVCTNTLCSVLGGQRIMDALSADLGVHHDETAVDGTITLEHAECLAACDYAPVVTVDYEFYDQQDVDSARELVAALRRGEKPLPTRGAPLTDFKGISRQLAGFSQHGDDAAARAAVDAPGEWGPTLVGLRLAEDRGEAAPEMPRLTPEETPTPASPGRPSGPPGGRARPPARRRPTRASPPPTPRRRRPAPPALTRMPPSPPDGGSPTAVKAPTPLRDPSRAPPARVPGRPEPCLSPLCSPPAGAPTSRGACRPTSRWRATPRCAPRYRWTPTSWSRW
ncbi:NADH-quinone oxidoreductase subunit NuoE [Blastococcus brunescens]|uniref:NADH-quinone oxidoreductase subunit NuoE n=1 Tax=Blastococcus brunescens TaxID=1564165 RepID=A0ABZ1AYY9_9ACTN|nr:NADH-quinone oxidoreductase subunit NuoE [Blastococcus sp. BMG 8361]WRL63141.1 NADH-quinone oxidoreductase subunit NuoE [Blastococcus sp. BMG 8361]